MKTLSPQLHSKCFEKSHNLPELSETIWEKPPEKPEGSSPFLQCYDNPSILTESYLVKTIFLAATKSPIMMV